MSTAAASAVVKGNLHHGFLLGCESFALRSVSFSSRVHIMAWGNCLGFVASLLKLLEKVSQPRGQTSLNGVVLTEALPNCPLNPGRRIDSWRRFRAWDQSPQVHKNKLSQAPFRRGVRVWTPELGTAPQSLK
jgi:hypothetical protein